MEVATLIIGEMWALVVGSFEISLKFLNIIFWAIAGAFILPCVFIAGNIYPLWEKWADNLKK